MMSRFCQYAEKVFGLSELMAGLKDSRPKARIPTQSVWAMGFAMCATRRGSLNAMEIEGRLPKRLEAIVGPDLPSADTVGRVYSQMEIDGQREMLCRIAHQFKRNKGLTTPKSCRLRFAAVDGHELFASRRRCCPECRQRTVIVNEKEVIEYYHRVVTCHLIGFEAAIPLDVEPIRPGEGETIATRRMLERVFKNYPRFFDGVIGDALYLDAPTFNFCLTHGKHVVAVLKGDERLLLQDARGVQKLVEPVQWEIPRGVVRCWDMEGFNTLVGVDEPVRVMHIEKTVQERQRIAGQWVEQQKVQLGWWATTAPQSKLSSRGLAKIVPERWDIENDQYNTLSTHWSMDHCYKHDLTAILNMILTLFVTYVLLQSFYFRNLKPAFRQKLTLIALASQLYLGLAAGGLPAPWALRPSGHPS